MRRNTRVVLSVGLLAGVLAAGLGLPLPAMAYKELTRSGRLSAPVGATCIEFQSELSHGGDTSPLKMWAKAFTNGTSSESYPSSPSGILCRPRDGVAKWTSGNLTLSLIKLVKAGSGSRPDSYSFCRIEQSPSFSISTSPVEFSKTYSTPPCGPGYYAEIACLNSSLSAVTSEGLFLLGTWDTTDVKRDCNVSPAWHPAFGNGTGQGGPVKL